MKLLDADKLADLAATLVAAGYRVVAPLRDAQGAVRLQVWSPGAAIDAAAIPANSAKEFLFPSTETIGRWSLDGGDFAPEPVRPAAPRTVLLAVRPCDVAGLAILDAVFSGDCRDAFYSARREATTIVALACSTADAECFCTSVGGAPDSAAGADAVLRPADGGRRFVLEPVTEKGAAVLKAAGATLAEGQAALDTSAEVPERFDAPAVAEWLGSNLPDRQAGFESPLWQDLGLACLGCGACTHVCPTCHCFDLQDEATRRQAVRLRNWDSCALALFTAHASGHNPRPTQVERWRQRVMHKFRYFQERFGSLACTGCGRCGRLCPAGVTMRATCAEIARAASLLRRSSRSGCEGRKADAK